MHFLENLNARFIKFYLNFASKLLNELLQFLFNEKYLFCSGLSALKQLF